MPGVAAVFKSVGYSLQKHVCVYGVSPRSLGGDL